MSCGDDEMKYHSQSPEKFGNLVVRCHYCLNFGEADMKIWAKVELKGETLYFHDRELGDCYNCWLLSPIVERE